VSDTENELVAALLRLPGVAAAALADDESDGPGTLRLHLTATADDVAVATAVNRLLREHFGLAVDTDRIRVLDAADPQYRPATGYTPKRAAAAAALAHPVVNGAAGGAAAHSSTRRVNGSASTSHTSTESTEGSPPMTSMTASVRGSRRRRLPRLAIQRMRLRVAGPDAHAAVWLLGAGGPVVGEAQAPSTPDGMSQAVASATLRAVAAGAPGRCPSTWPTST
jgi:hypothetical protein